MKENKVQFIAITAMAVALTYVFTEIGRASCRERVSGIV